MPLDMAKYRAVFVEEATEHLADISRALLELEKDAGRSEAIDQIFRMAHSIKGMAASLEYGTVTELAHRLEDRMQAIRAAGRVPGGDELSLLFRGLAGLERMVARGARHRAGAARRARAGARADGAAAGRRRAGLKKKSPEPTSAELTPRSAPAPGSAGPAAPPPRAFGARAHGNPRPAALDGGRGDPPLEPGAHLGARCGPAAIRRARLDARSHGPRGRRPPAPRARAAHDAAAAHPRAAAAGRARDRGEARQAGRGRAARRRARARPLDPRSARRSARAPAAQRRRPRPRGAGRARAGGQARGRPHRDRGAPRAGHDPHRGARRRSRDRPRRRAPPRRRGGPDAARRRRRPAARAGGGR